MEKRGFTLIELLVVITIIGLLSAVVLASMTGTRSKGRDTKRVADLKQLQLALQLYYDQHSSYPSALADLTTGNYISVVPTDPMPEKYTYSYTQLSSGSDYVLAAQLENAGSGLDAYTQNLSITLNGVSANCNTFDTAHVFCVKP